MPSTTLRKRDKPFKDRPTPEQIRQARELARKVSIKALDMFNAKTTKDNKGG